MRGNLIIRLLNGDTLGGAVDDVEAFQQTVNEAYERHANIGAIEFRTVKLYIYGEDEPSVPADLTTVPLTAIASVQLWKTP